MVLGPRHPSQQLWFPLFLVWFLSFTGLLCDYPDRKITPPLPETEDSWLQLHLRAMAAIICQVPVNRHTAQMGPQTSQLRQTEIQTSHIPSRGLCAALLGPSQGWRWFLWDSRADYAKRSGDLPIHYQQMVDCQWDSPHSEGLGDSMNSTCRLKAAQRASEGRPWIVLRFANDGCSP